MRRLITILASIFFLNTLSSQDFFNLPIGKGTQETSNVFESLSNIRKISQQSGLNKSSDILWVPAINEIHEWSIDHYYLKYLGYIEYYTDVTHPYFSQLKSFVGIDPITKDSTYKLLFTYYLNGKHEEIITQNYDTTTNEWMNSSLTKIFFDQYGHDSVTLVKTWNSQIGDWVNSERLLMHRNEMEAIILYASEIWQGSLWYRYFASKFTYFNNEFGCTDSIHEHVWMPDINFWRHYRIWYLQYDENNVRTTLTEVYFDQSTQQWTNYLHGSEYKFENWTGCFDQWRNDMKACHMVTQMWMDTSWVNYRRISSTYDSLGGKEDIVEYFDGIDWQLTQKNELRFLKNGNFDFQLYYEWNGEKWIEFDGYNSEYIYVNDTLIESFNDRWNTGIMNWGPYFLYKYKNYIGLPLVSSVIERQTLHTGVIRLAPNPARESFMVELLFETDYITEVEIIDQQGRIVFVNFLKQRDARTVRMDSSLLPSGLYIVRTKTNNHEVFHNKLIRK
jgi:hypothetical protein